MKFQVMPDLTSEEYEELKADIAKKGVVVPVIVDEDGNIIDGHNRVQIAKELGIPYPVEMRDELTDAEKRGMAFALNLHRRQLTQVQRRDLLEKSIRADPELSSREHAKRVGTSNSTAALMKRELVEKGEVCDSHTSRGADGKTYPSTQPERKPITDLPPTAPITPEEVKELAPEPTTDPTPEPEADTPRAQAITAQFSSAIADLNKVLNKFHRITNDGNFNRNKNQVATLHGNDLARAIRELQTLADQLH